jgi:hypothetical protein
MTRRIAFGHCVLHKVCSGRLGVRGRFTARLCALPTSQHTGAHTAHTHAQHAQRPPPVRRNARGRGRGADGCVPPLPTVQRRRVSQCRWARKAQRIALARVGRYMYMLWYVNALHHAHWESRYTRTLGGHTEKQKQQTRGRPCQPRRPTSVCTTRSRTHSPHAPLASLSS